MIDLAIRNVQVLDGTGPVGVNGAIAWQDGRPTGAGTGKMLRYRRAAYGED